MQVRDRMQCHVRMYAQGKDFRLMPVCVILMIGILLLGDEVQMIMLSEVSINLVLQLLGIFRVLLSCPAIIQL